VFFAPGKGTSFKVTAKAGSVLPYFCAVHPWMQGKITVS
jgi:plastocyanin